MNNLKITQNTSAEKVTDNTISKLYKLTIGDSTTPSIAQNVELEGYIRADHGKRAQIKYLKEKFPKLQIDVPESGLYLDFDDPVFEQFIIDTWFPEQSGVTLVNALSIDRMPRGTFDNFENTSEIETIDFRYSRFGSWEDGFFGLPKLKYVYIKSVASITNLNSFHKDAVIEKCIIGRVEYVFGGGPYAQNCHIKILGIKSFGVNENNKYGDYLVRRSTIDKLYLGDPVAHDINFGYGDDINRIGEVYVPVGMKETFAAMDGWSKRDPALGFIEYDFDTDPDGIFAELNT